MVLQQIRNVFGHVGKVLSNPVTTATKVMEASKVLADENYTPMHPAQRNIELGARMAAMATIHTDESDNPAYASKLTAHLLDNMESLVEEGKTDAAMEGLRQLAVYSGFEASRRREILPEQFMRHLKSGHLDWVTDEIVSEVEAIVEADLNRSNSQRLEDYQHALANEHKRYPGDFLSELADPHSRGVVNAMPEFAQGGRRDYGGQDLDGQS